MKSVDLIPESTTGRGVCPRRSWPSLLNDLIPHFEALFLCQLSHHAGRYTCFPPCSFYKIPGLEGQHRVIKTASFLASESSEPCALIVFGSQRPVHVYPCYGWLSQAPICGSVQLHISEHSGGLGARGAVADDCRARSIPPASGSCPWRLLISLCHSIALYSRPSSS